MGLEIFFYVWRKEYFLWKHKDIWGLLHGEIGEMEAEKLALISCWDTVKGGKRRNRKSSKLTYRRQPCEHNCWKSVWLTKLNVSVWTIYNSFHHEPSLICKGTECDGNFESAIPNKHLKEIPCGCVWKSLSSSSHIQGWI